MWISCHTPVVTYGNVVDEEKLIDSFVSSVVWPFFCLFGSLPYVIQLEGLLLTVEIAMVTSVVTHWYGVMVAKLI